MFVNLRTRLLPLLLLTTAAAAGQQLSLPQCGAGNRPPYAPASDGKDRVCDRTGKRNYVPHHKGIGFEILDAESKACFVPDQEYRLLDDVIDAVLSKIKYNPASKTPKEQALQISNAVSDTLLKNGFVLYIDTETLSDALLDRNAPTEAKRRIFDCDTGSFIFLTVAESIGARVALVEVPLPGSKNHHNFVRWLDGESDLLDWDMNLRSECTTPAGLTDIEGKSMTREQSLAYALSLRTNLWERRKLYDNAVGDFRQSMQKYNGSSVYNNFAWLVATREVTHRDTLAAEALASAKHAIAIWPSPNYKDTLACVNALVGNFSGAISVETEAFDEMPDPSYKRHLDMFKSNPPRNCTGE